MRVTWLVFAVATLVGCYDQPSRNCPFACGPGGECPNSFECAADNLCHRVQSGGGILPCEVDLPDSPLTDSPIADSRVDANGDAPDAQVDAPVDAQVDAQPDGRPDARPDASNPIPDAVISLDATPTRTRTGSSAVSYRSSASEP